MSWGYINTTGVSTVNSTYISDVLMYNDQHVALPGERVTGFRLYCNDSTAPANFTMFLGVRDVTDGVANAPLLISKSFVMPLNATGVWAEVLLDSPIFLVAGRKYARAMNEGQSSANGSVYYIAATNYSRENATSPVGEFSSNYASTGFANVSRDYCMEVITEIISDPVINTSSSTKIAARNASATIVLDNITVNPPVSIALYDPVSGITAVQSNFNYNGGQITFTTTRGNLPYKANLSLRVTLDDDSVLEETNFFEITAETTGQFTTLTAPLNNSDTTIYEGWTTDGNIPNAIAAGMQIKIPLLSNQGATLTISNKGVVKFSYGSTLPPILDSVTYELWDGVTWRQAVYAIGILEINLNMLAANATTPYFDSLHPLGNRV